MPRLTIEIGGYFADMEIQKGNEVDFKLNVEDDYLVVTTSTDKEVVTFNLPELFEALPIIRQEYERQNIQTQKTGEPK